MELIKSGAKRVYFTEKNISTLNHTEKSIRNKCKDFSEIMGKCSFHTLDWHSCVPIDLEIDKGQSYILLSDCFYDKYDFENVIYVIYWFAKNFVKSRILVCQEIRCPDWSLEPILEIWNLRSVFLKKYNDNFYIYEFIIKHYSFSHLTKLFINAPMKQNIVKFILI